MLRLAPAARRMPVRCATRASSVLAIKPEPVPMTMQSATAVSRITLDFLRHGHPGMRLEAIEDEHAGKPVHAKWQAMVQVLIMTQAHTLSGFGYEATQDGLQRYRADLQRLMASRAASAPDDLAVLSAVDKAIWAELLLRAFAVAPRHHPLPVDAARELVAAAAAAMQTRAFLETLDERVGALPGGRADATREARFEVLHELSTKAHLEAAAPHGFALDDGGYVQLQAALVEHMFDQQIIANMNSAMIAVTRRAGIDLSLGPLQ